MAYLDDNLPIGSVNDPKAPWNNASKKVYLQVDCELCSDEELDDIISEINKIDGIININKL